MNMAYLSRKCIFCSERSKRCVQEYRSKDENGKAFSVNMYACDNLSCSINQERRQALKKKAKSRRQSDVRPIV